ncbi:bifunctional UDP-N-acetylmuramoyl-tripeptide:D-alanyl-D-alanine ligase/alanine racemase [Mangrovibacterium diazotrophicum]|uniref:Alanine racemase n=1 Tax=Mangrovibacterium diazotrophicum TaxID=1261403 RepID=A0A419WBL9_9BACT|nr:bifunctional UDP-N-acetylmuramoyl-tripeptide:D-alanyl-D-alanine ligase/alanine racemase [Mangrovibacterium diazotrophicum]RKD92796.1 alanine racemase [Mangrovibacterium diazotrophicum]
MAVFGLKEIAGLVNGVLKSAADLDSSPTIQSVSIDSRTIADVHSCLFFALKGVRHNGHQYIGDLYHKGVLSFVVCEPIEVHKYPLAYFVKVEDSLDALQKLAAAVRAKYDYPVLAITGSNGKTIVKEWLYDLLHETVKIIRSPKSYNSQVGVPLSVWNMSDQFELAIFEAGISMPGEMEKLAEVIQPTVGIITNLGEAHQENFSSLSKKLDEKLKLFASCDSLIYRKEQDLVTEQIGQTYGKGDKKLFAWSTSDETADLFLYMHPQAHSTRIQFNWNGREYELNVPFTDFASLENVGHCLAFIFSSGYANDSVMAAFSQLQAVAMRLELKQGINNCLLINDYYNSDINSLTIALQFLKSQSMNEKRPRCLILSDIEQSGFSGSELAQAVNRLLKVYEIDRLIGIGRRLYLNRELFVAGAKFYQSTEEFLTNFRPAEFRNEHILLKGARDFRFERIASVLQQKYHQTQLEVNLNNLVENLNRYRARLNPETKITIMVKAFSYGSGTVEIARALEFQQVDYLAVAVADEGIELRQAGISTPIMVMNPEEHSFEMMLEYRLEPNIYSTEVYEQFDRAARRMAVSNFPIHLKLETGMHRLGFSSADELEQIALRVPREGRLRIQSVFSHLAASDSSDHDGFTKEQFLRFKKLSTPVVANQPNKVIRHILNSAGIERFADYQMEMVRLGIGLYGVSQSDALQAETVARWTTVISQVKTVAAGETVGYGRKGKVTTPKQVAIIPVGYADGYDRRLSNGAGKVWIAGRQYPIIGNICMDMSMIDVTGADVQAGESVELMGEHIRLTDLADWMGTIPYEVLTGISQRVRRVYIQE